MPKESGIEVLQELNRLREALPTVVLTTFDDDPLFPRLLYLRPAMIQVEAEHSGFPTKFRGVLAHGESSQLKRIVEPNSPAGGTFSRIASSTRSDRRAISSMREPIFARMWRMNWPASDSGKKSWPRGSSPYYLYAVMLTLYT